MSDLKILPMDDVITSYYLRLRVQDKPGVLADITRILADEHISIGAVIQKEPGEGEAQADLIMLTHQTREKRINTAIVKIEALGVVAGKVTRLRMEELGK
jgi:homoserine dehydrogenase